MTSDEIKEAMKWKRKVVYNGITYDYIEEYVMRYDNSGRRVLSLGLIHLREQTDDNGKKVMVTTIVRAPYENVRLAE